MTTLRDTFRLLFPDVRRTDVFSEPPILPADIFAFAAYVLEASGAYHHITPETGTPGSKRHIVIDGKLRGRAVRTGREWRETPVRPRRLPPVPTRVEALWQSLDTFEDEEVFVPLTPDAECPQWWEKVIELLMIADEASEELGFDSGNTFYSPIAEVWIGVQKGPRYGGDRRLKGTPISMV